MSFNYLFLFREVKKVTTGKVASPVSFIKREGAERKLQSIIDVNHRLQLSPSPEI